MKVMMAESFSSVHMLIFYIVTNSLCKIDQVHASVATGSAGVSSNGIKSDKPFFDEIYPRNISTVVDDVAILKCVVKNKGDRTVSWMRKRDLHILTSNNFLYTGDQRFSVIHPQDSDEWNLKIEYAQPKDAGTYECQVNTEPKINFAVNLDVGTAARAKIIGSQEVHIKKGSTISLTCMVNIYGSAISWYHGNTIVNFDSDRGGISLEQEKTETGTTSRLLLTRANFRDSGNYSCVPLGALSASIIVHVLNGEIPQAMQTSDAVYPPRPLYIALLALSTFFYNIS
ncbi:CLUMA_CG012622, isoform A [Clunio marinus]|uniref:CLUMA_CG012622, isoform A n=1 Tax=Clunio marinus TaxID=568069 RepID=A0A1J1IID7_9DIPT|nr:CLUMA_CG012622, isoform A [Clunio marinus]